MSHVVGGAAGRDVDWAGLRAGAVDAARRAYAPYSGLRVGAAAVTEDGRTVSGCNVENASYGLSLCAECGVVSALHASGGGRLVALSVVAGDGEPLAPCGRCRQLLLEAGGVELLVDAPGSPLRLGDLLPGAFTGDELAGRRDPGQAAGPGAGGGA
ncbi:MAG: cytidine deaminase [Acidimicrobiales bacterium]